MKQLKYAIQNVIRGKGSNIVKVVSITLGLLVSVILIAKVAYELSYDNFYRDNEQLYVVKTGWDGGKPLHGNNICLLYTSPSPRDRSLPRMPSSA